MNNKNIKIKILLSIILLLILSALTYISLPYISNALELDGNKILDAIGKVTASNGSEVKNEIHEHRGYKLIAPGQSATEAATYENAAGNTGISNIGAVLSEFVNDAYDWSLGWYFSLQKNTSIFCQERGVPFPNLNNKYLQRFHGGKVDTNTFHLGKKEEDYLEIWAELTCVNNSVKALEEDYPDDGIVPKETDVFEADLVIPRANDMCKYNQFTLVRVDYKASEREFDTVESYIFTYSLRNWYTYNPAQAALWMYKYEVQGKGTGTAYGNAVEQGRRLFNAAMAVDELKEPTKPTMSATTDNTLAKNTGTVIDGDNYKVGPIYMNNYSYAYSENVKEFSGQSSLENPANADMISRMTPEQKAVFQGLICGIVEAKVELDNGTILYLDKDNITYSEQDTNQTTFKNTYYESPSLHGYEFPTPNSKFYINLPIADCVGATSVKKITMKYKWHTADGNGGDLSGVYDELMWENKWDGDKFTHASYHCDNSYGGYECVHDSMAWSSRSCFPGDAWHGDVNRTAHAFWCGTDGYCFRGTKGSHYHCIEKDYCSNSCKLHYCTDMGYSGCTCPGGHEEECSKCDGWGDTYHDYNCKDYDGDGVKDPCEGHTCTKCNGSGDVPLNGTGKCSGCECNKRHIDCNEYADLDYCIHGHQDGKHTGSHSWSHADHIHQCYGPEGVGTRCNCHPDADGGGHRNCYRFVWEVIKETEDIHSQDLMYVTDAQVYEHNVECYLEDIPLVAKVEIDKFILEVKHENETTPYFNSEARKDLEEDVKEDNPVYVETEDFVTYKLVLTNHSAFGVKVRADDILPDASAYKFISAYVGGTKLTDIKELRKSIIQINANSEASITITIQVIANNKLNHDDSDEYENLGRIITRNGHDKDSIDDPEPKDVDYVRTVDDDGPVVNHEDVTCNGTTNEPDIESSDWFKLNNYNAFIDKYVYSYDEKVLKENNDFGISKEDSVIGADGQLLQEVDGKDVSRRNLTKTTKEVSDGNVMDIIRTDDKAKETYKGQHPVNVEQGEKITYAIRVSNEAKEIAKSEPTGTKPATKLKNLRIEDIMHEGLVADMTITGKIFDYVDGVNDTLVKTIGGSLSGSGGKYYITALAGEDEALEPNQYVEFYINVDVVQSNMYLPSMENSAELVAASNINDVVIYDKDNKDTINRMISEQTVSTEFVRMKDLLIAGYVWLDIDQDGLMNDTARSELDKVNNNINDNAMKEDVIVRLYRVDGDVDTTNGMAKGTEIRKTKTDENGLYTFARAEGSSSWYDTFNHTVDYEPDGTAVNDVRYQRIDKADGKDEYGNYTDGSEYYSYYVEFEYDGVLYRSTEIYADNKNLNGDGSFKSEEYTIDSNAMELTSDREEFNKRYEYISYNVAYDMDMAKSGDLVFQKDGHSSYLMEDPARDMTAKSFITEDTELIKLLWLYHTGGDNTLPKTDYLKYINLGLELREDVDLALTKDVYNLKTTVNGEEMEYDFNLGDTANFLNDYIVKKPYGFEIYESDYKYRVEQYIANAVEAYKGINGEDELNIEITYRINLQNLTTKDDEEMAALEPDNPEVNKNTPLYARVHEILDLYDENFMEFTEEAIKVKVKNAEGFLEDKEIEVAEAWMFMTEEEAEGKELLDADKKYKPRKASDGTNTSNNDIFVEDANGDYVKVKLTMSDTSMYSAKSNDFKDDGYHTAYITGMGDQVIPEGEDMNIYVKYVVDKDKLEITVDEDYETTTTTIREAYSETTQKVEVTEIVNDNITAVITDILTETITDGGATKTETTAKLDRSLRLKDNRVATNPFKQQNGRGTENIAQIDAYSVWYDEAGTVPASLVDKDSNAGNIGIKNTSTNASPNGSGYSEEATSADDIDFYEDTTYKTGIELAAEGSEQTRDEVEEEYDARIPDVDRIIEITTEYDLIRKITGKVWDDSRSTELGSGNEIQYVANGMYNTSDTKLEEAKDNKNVELNYKEPEVTEETDIAVRNAKAEFIEIVNIPRIDGDGNYILDADGNKQFDYYEEVLTNVTWDQVQNVRTGENGEYTLEGFKPGRYIVRFTYGDVEEIAKDGTNKWDKIAEFDDRIKDLSERTDLTESQKYAEREAILNERNLLLESDPELLAVKDMLIFNGQDYKSTKYTGVQDDPTLKEDEVIKGFQEANNSDARDDEVRRLEVNAYSEIMTNEMAEILKGLVNGNKTYTPNSTANTSTELKALTDNTYMEADTVEFLIKPEKLIETETIKQKLKYESEYKYDPDLPYYKYLTALKTEHIKERDFTIENVDFGIEYRPESQISLMKEIKEITLKTTAKNGESDILVNLHFTTEGDGVNRTHKIIEEDSIGYELVQFITNNYTDKTLINNVMSEEALQGLVYIQVDEEILQGCTIEITYGFDAQNNSEIDRISSKLNAIRYRDNKATDDLIADYNTKYASQDHKTIGLLDLSNVMNTKYTASGLAKAAAFADAYALDDQGLVYREIPKVTTTNGNDGYYGRFVGHGYYIGEVSDLDTISSLKFDKILDYIDTNLEYEQKTNSEEMTNKLWSKITSKELVGLVSQYKAYRDADEATIAGIKVTNIDGIEYKSMVVSVDDRNVDPGDPNDNGDVKNKDLSKFLLPKVSLVGMFGEDVVGSEDYEKYTGHIYLDVSKVLAAGSDADDKTYENMAEIVQFTTLNGRRTNFATTIGNADIKAIKEKLDNNLPPFDSVDPSDPKNPGSVEFITASIEPDTSATETITLIPPTGLMRSRRPIAYIMEATKTGVEVMSMVGLVVAIVIAIGAVVVYTTRRVQRRRIK